MNEVLLQTIVEKLEALEIALLKQSPPAKEGESSKELVTAVKSVQTELIKLNSKVRTNTDCITNLSNQINTLRLNFADPEQNQVKHIHHFHKHIWDQPQPIHRFIIICLWMDELPQRKKGI